MEKVKLGFHQASNIHSCTKYQLDFALGWYGCLLILKFMRLYLHDVFFSALASSQLSKPDRSSLFSAMDAQLLFHILSNRLRLRFV